MSVRYTREALRDIDQISSYIAERNVGVAAAFLESVASVVQRLERYPYSAQKTKMEGIRATPISRFPYLIFYTAENDGIVVHYVRHAARLRPWEEKG